MSDIQKEDLRKWFGSGPEGGKGGGGWDRYNTKGERIGKCARGEGEGKPKCLSNEKASKMSKAERASAVNRKRRQDPVADRPGKGGKPIMTSNKIKEEIVDEAVYGGTPAKKEAPKDNRMVVTNADKKANTLAYQKMKAGDKRYKSADHMDEGKGDPCWDSHKQVGMKKKGGKMVTNCVPKNAKEEHTPMVKAILERIECENEWILVEKNVPTKPALWSKFKSQAKAKFDVYPSAYANGWAAKKYKAAGGSWKTATKEEVEYLDEKKKCVHNHKDEECPIHGMKECPSEKIDESVRIPAQTGNVYSVVFSWRAKTYMIKLFFPEIRKPKRDEVQDAIQKIYPGSTIRNYNLSPFQPGEQFVNAGVYEEVENVDVDSEVEEGYKVLPKEKMARQSNKAYGKEQRAVSVGDEKETNKQMQRRIAMQNPAGRKAQLTNKKKVEVDEAAAWTKKSGKNPEGGLNEKGRKSYERDNPGSDLKSPSKKVGNKRRSSFCARMKGMKKKLTSAKTANDPDSRINKSLRAWNC